MNLDHIAEPLRALAVPVSSLNLDPANVRRHSARNLSAIEASLKRWGQRLPIVVQREGMIVRAGNGRLEVARRMGWEYIAAVVVDGAHAEETAFAIADNRTAELADWDDDALRAMVAALPKDAAAAAWGSDEDIRELMAGGRPDLKPDAPQAVLKDVVTQPGDLWLLPSARPGLTHRLLCGSSVRGDDVNRVMNGEKAALCSTDPPYLVEYTGERVGNSGKDWSEVYNEVEIKDAAAFFTDLFTQVLRVIAPHAALYCWHAHRRIGEIQAIWRKLGILDHQQIVWVKPTSVFGSCMYHFQHEPCIVGWVQGSKPRHDGKHDTTSVWVVDIKGQQTALSESGDVWAVDWQGKSRIIGNEHPTEKPVEIFARPIRKHTLPGEVVFEPFSGSGSQLVAAEQEGRRCYAIELEPRFVDVAVRRWQAMTGRDAVRESDGVKFSAVQPVSAGGRITPAQPSGPAPPSP